MQQWQYKKKKPTSSVAEKLFDKIENPLGKFSNQLSINYCEKDYQEKSLQNITQNGEMLRSFSFKSTKRQTTITTSITIVQMQ